MLRQPRTLPARAWPVKPLRPRKVGGGPKPGANADAIVTSPLGPTRNDPMPDTAQTEDSYRFLQDIARDLS
jgi:hypothetical protein